MTDMSRWRHHVTGVAAALFSYVLLINIFSYTDTGPNLDDHYFNSNTKLPSVTDLLTKQKNILDLGDTSWPPPSFNRTFPTEQQKAINQNPDWLDIQQQTRNKSQNRTIIGLSDHNLVLVARKLSKKRFGVSTVKEQESFRILKDQEHLKNTVNNTNWDSLLTGKDVYEGSKILSSKLQCIIKEFTCRLTHRKKGSSLAWINADILKKKWKSVTLH